MPLRAHRYELALNQSQLISIVAFVIQRSFVSAQEHGWKTLHFDGWPRGGGSFSWKKLVAELEFEQLLMLRNTMEQMGWKGM